MCPTRTVYIDVLLGVNLFVNYFLLLAVARFFCVDAKKMRLIGGALLGALFSLAIFLPEPPPVAGLLGKLLLSAAIVRAAFPWRSWNVFWRSIACFYLMSFAFAGFMLCFWYFVSPQGLLIKNSVVYFDISPLFLIFATVLCYGVLRLVNRVTGRQEPAALICRLIMERDGKRAECVARVDTGNSLREPFSGYPVVVVQKSVVEELIPAQPAENGGVLRLVPFQAVSGGGLLNAFRPDKLTVIVKSQELETSNAYIAVCETALSGGEFSALVSPDLLP